ncbi:MAG: hypothetical protein ACM3TR_06020 [Caulobacteraceae bacterium]
MHFKPGQLVSLVTFPGVLMYGLTQQILTGIGSFVLNTILGVLISLPAAIQVVNFGSGSLLNYFLLWLGVSIAMHSFRRNGDAMGLFVWLNLLYGIGVAVLLPELLVKLLA